MHINNKLKEEANRLLEMGLKDLLAPYKYYITGSYDLDVMAWPDLDLYIDVSNIEQKNIYEMVNRIFTIYQPTWLETKDTFSEESGCPKGYFLGFETKILNDRLWNFDLWFTDSSTINEHFQYIHSLKQKMSEDKKEMILSIKENICHHEAYGKTFFSIDLYQAILDDGVTLLREFETWLKQNKDVIL